MYKIDDAEFRIHLNNKLCEVVDLLLIRYNPCHWVDNECLNGHPYCCVGTNYDIPDTVSGCIFLKPGGCTVRSIGCKVWFCKEAEAKLDFKLKRALKAIEIIARIFHLSSFAPDDLIADVDEYPIDKLLRDFNAPQ